MLQPNWAITYRGGDKLLVYDEKGRFKKALELTVDSLKLSPGNNNLRIGAQFSGSNDVKLEGYVRLKDKIDIIKTAE